jgi:predicted GH43/DUF377 family glycosyl hydrolase
VETELQPFESEAESLAQYQADVEHGLEALADLEDVQAVVGVPFVDEDDTLPGVVATARKGLYRAGLSGKSLVLCVGPSESGDTLEAAVGIDGPDRGVPVRGFLHCRGLEGRGWSLRALMEAASKLGAALLLLPPDLESLASSARRLGRGYSPPWIPRLLTPILHEKQDLALARFSRHPLAHPVESLLVFPILAGVFGFRLRQPTPGVFAMSHKLVRLGLSETGLWSGVAGLYGFDPWIVSRAIVDGLAICEVPMGRASFRHGTGQLKLVFRQVANAILRQVVRNDLWWHERTDPVAAPRVYGSHLDVTPPPYRLRPDAIRRRFRFEFNHFDDTLFQRIMPGEEHEQSLRLRAEKDGAITLDEEEWIRVLKKFLVAYRFEREFHPDDIVDGLYPFFLARLATFIDEVGDIETSFADNRRIGRSKAAAITRREAEHALVRQADVFVDSWPRFRQVWRDRERETAPYLARLGAWEFVPGVGVIVPQELDRREGGSIWAHEVYRELIARYREEFREFLASHLGIEERVGTSNILSRLHGFMHRLDSAIGAEFYPPDISTVDGAHRAASAICHRFAARDTGDGNCFQLTPEAAQALVKRNPPRNLILLLGCANVGELLQRFDPGDVLGMAGWIESPRYLDRVLDIIGRDGEPSWFHTAPARPVVVDLRYLSGATELSGTSALARLAGRVMAVNQEKGTGGEFSRLWFVLKLTKSIIGGELFAGIWQDLAANGGDFGRSVVNSIRGHWGRRVMSAHNAFENHQQRILVDRLRRFARELEPEIAEAAAIINAAAGVYHLSITLPDATFIPLSAWTWASYHARGGLGTPTPLSSLVERDWATRDFLTAYLERAGIADERQFEEQVLELVSTGRESEDLRQHLFGVKADPDRLVVSQTPRSFDRPAGRLIRPVERPILEPVSDHAWESHYVLNAAAVRLDGMIYILYRGYGEDKVSRIGLAWTRDGVHIDGRLDHPIFEPADATEAAGVEDPRVTMVGDEMYMLYTAWDQNVAQIAMASIPVDEFLRRRFSAWRRHGLGFPKLANKDAVLYPETFDGRYVIYHRIDPNLWISYLDNLTCPWPRQGQKIVTGPRPGMMWDGIKVGAGAPPIKTTHGWLNIYHGVDYERSYRLGVLFMALDDPAKVIYRSPNAILEPETDFEIGEGGGESFWVPHVVFTCGAVPAEDKAVIGPDDEILVYYGAADTAIGVARGRLCDLVPVLKDNLP